MPRHLSPLFIQQEMNRARLEKHPALLSQAQEYNAACERQETNQFNPLDPSFDFVKFVQSNPFETQTVISAANSADVLLKEAALQEMLLKVIRSEKCIEDLKFSAPWLEQNEASTNLAVELLEIISDTGANIDTELGYIITNACMGCNMKMAGIIKEVFNIE